MTPSNQPVDLSHETAGTTPEVHVEKLSITPLAPPPDKRSLTVDVITVVGMVLILGGIIWLSLEGVTVLDFLSYGSSVVIIVGLALGVVLLVLVALILILQSLALPLRLVFGRERMDRWTHSLTDSHITIWADGEYITVRGRAFFLTVAAIAWSAFRHPFSTTSIDYSTGKIIAED